MIMTVRGERERTNNCAMVQRCTIVKRERGERFINRTTVQRCTVVRSG